LVIQLVNFLPNRKLSHERRNNAAKNEHTRGTKLA
jgi:hypothetical protein